MFSPAFGPSWYSCFILLIILPWERPSVYYGKLLRQIVEALRGVPDIPQHLDQIHKGIDQHKEAVNAASARSEEQSQIRRKFAENVFAANQEAEADKAIRENRGHRIQNSLRWATWIAAGGAIFYGAVATYQAIQMRKATEAATKSANTAACALRENQRQFQLMFPEVAKQTETQQGALNLQRLAFELQSSPYASIEIKGVNATIYGPTHGSQLDAIKPRSISITYVVRNSGFAPTLHYASGFDFHVIDLPGSERFNQPCQSEIDEVRATTERGVIPGEGGETARVTKIAPGLAIYGRDYIQAVGCVAFTGVSNPDRIQTSAILVTIHVDRAKGGATFGARPIQVEDQQ